MPSSEEQVFRQPVRFLSTAAFAKLIEQPFDLAPKSTAAISVADRSRIQFKNTGSFNVTDLTKAQDGQLVLLLGDGFTTLKNNSRLVLGADLLLVANKVYPVLYQNGAWYPFPLASSPSAGAGISVSGSTIANLYVGKHVTLYAGTPITHNAGSTWFPNSVNSYVSQQDLTGMTQYRVGYAAKSSGGNSSTPTLSYSIDSGASFTDFTSLGSHTHSGTSIEFVFSAWTSLPAGARIADCVLGVKMNVSANTDIYTISAEFKP